MDKAQEVLGPCVGHQEVLPPALGSRLNCPQALRTLVSGVLCVSCAYSSYSRLSQSCTDEISVRSNEKKMKVLGNALQKGWGLELNRREKLSSCCKGLPSGEARGGTSLDPGNKVSGWYRPLGSILKCRRVERRNRVGTKKGRPKSSEKLQIQRIYFQGSFLKFCISNYGLVLALQS